jgi:UDP-N-acetylglucosamine 2-epimerase (non-hydrolysing)
MKIISVVGARPNFMKISPFIHAIEKFNLSNKNVPPFSGKERGEIKHILVHTGQHYDDKLSKSFFKELNIPNADINLGVGSGSHAEQVGNTMIKLEKILQKEKPDWVVVVGDVNATLATSITAKKLHIKVCHIEAGLRSGDMTMPEEINRLVTDRLSDLLLTPDHISIENLKKEGTPDNRIVFVGNIMIDTLESNRAKAAELKIEKIIQDNLLISSPHLSVSLSPSLPLSPSSTHNFALITLHRPSNVDKKIVLEPIINFLTNDVTRDMPIIWPIHPRTLKQLKAFNLWNQVINNKNLILLHPIGYQEMLRLNMDAKIVLTDSGGLQEECTVLGTPCLTLRWNTERPVTLRKYGGTSVLVGNNVDNIRKEYNNALQKVRNPVIPELWDGNTAIRCIESLINR